MLHRGKITARNRKPISTRKRHNRSLHKRNGNFPRAISDQKYNDYIKDVCQLAGLKHKVEGSIKRTETKRKETGLFEKYKLVCSHIGRRSFATNFYSKIPTSLLIAATGHSTEKMFLKYIGKSDDTKAKELSEAFDKLETKEIVQNN